jgi:hypothetical protein
MGALHGKILLPIASQMDINSTGSAGFQPAI